MRIVYRMRGLLGDATEEFIESLDSTTGMDGRFHRWCCMLNLQFGTKEQFTSWDIGVFLPNALLYL